MSETLTKVLRYMVDFDGTLSPVLPARVLNHGITHTSFFMFDDKKRKLVGNGYALIFKLAKAYFDTYKVPIPDTVVVEQLSSRNSLNDAQKDSILEILDNARFFDARTNELDFAVSELREHYVTHSLYAITSQAVTSATVDPMGTVRYIQDGLAQLQGVASVSEDPFDSSMFGDAFLQKQYDQFMEGRINEATVPYGWKEWDTVLGGMRPGELTILSGSVGAGKSFLGHEIAYKAVLEHGKRVVIAEHEMLPTQVYLRWMARQSNIPSRKLRLGPEALTKQELRIFQEAHKEVTELLSGDRLLIVPINKCDNVPQLEREIRLFYPNEPPDLVLVDYLDELQDVRPHQHDHERISAVTTSLKRLSMTLPTHVFTMTQLNAKGLENPGKAGISEIAHKSITRKADLILLMYENPDMRYQPPSPGQYVGTPGQVLVRILKNRSESSSLTFALEVELATSKIAEAHPLGIPTTITDQNYATDSGDEEDELD